MSITKQSTINMSREDWLEERRKSLGGSDMGAILGLNPWRSPYSVWADKRGLLPEKPDSEAMRIGRDLEPYVLKRFSEASGLKTRRVNAIIRNTDFPHLHANVDSMIARASAGVEAKTASALNTRAFNGGEFPASYYAQCVAYMAITGAREWYLAVLIMGREFKIYHMTRDPAETFPEWCESSVFVTDEEISTIAAYAVTFWQWVEEGTPPPVDDSKSTADTLGALYPDASEDVVDLTAVHDSVAGLIAVNKQIKALKQVADGYANEIKALMGEAGTGADALGRVTWKNQTRRTLDAKALAKDYPQINLDRYYKTTETRVFKVTPAKDNKKGDFDE